MSKKVLLILSVLVIGVLVAACGGAGSSSAPAAAPTTAPAAAAPKATDAPKAAAPTAAPAAAAKATDAPKAASGGAAPSFKAVPIKLWSGWTGTEAETLAAVAKQFESANSGAKIEILTVPFDQLKNKYTTEASTGGGPDLLIGPKDWIGELAQAKLISSLDDSKDAAGLNNVSKEAVTANSFQGKVYAFPESTEAMALFINTDKVKTMPTNSDDILKMATEVGMGLNTGFYQSAGFLFGQGAKLFDAQGKCILDQGTGAVEALKWIQTASKTPKVIADADGGKLDAAFKDGRVGMVFNGPWATGDYEKALTQAKVGVNAPIVMLPANGKFAPFLGTKNLFLSSNSKGDAKNTALGFMNFLSQPAQQETFAKIGHIPSNPNVNISDPILKAFIAQTLSTTYFPNEPEMGAVWTPASDMITKVVEGKATPEEAVKTACAQINAANKK
ncbi:MAG: extracellular solute-binding protein [Anaerolineae bacterium]